MAPADLGSSKPRRRWPWPPASRARSRRAARAACSTRSHGSCAASARPGTPPRRPRGTWVMRTAESGGTARAHERQPVPLRRVQRHRRGDQRNLCGGGGGEMNPFTYTRATDAEDAVRRGGEAQAKYLGGGTNLVDLLRETVERPGVPGGCHRPPGCHRGTRGWQPPDRRGGPEHGGRGTPGGADALSRALPRHRGGRVGADPQHGDDGRQPPPAHPLHVFLRRRRLALQQAPARPGLRRHRRASTASTRSWAPRPRAWPPTPPTCAWRSRRSTPSCICAARTASARCR